MARAILDGAQDFSKFREGGYFYVDKTPFIREWWSGPLHSSDVSLILRPRRFGKTLLLSMVEQFFSTRYAGRADLFEGLDVWKDKKFHLIQGTWPVIFLSLAAVKGTSFAMQKTQITQEIVRIFSDFRATGLKEALDPDDQERFSSINMHIDEAMATGSLNLLCELLYRRHGKKTIILLDEYDTPLQEAWVGGFWSETVAFLRNMFNATFKTNPYLERAILTGITRVSRESMFSDLNNVCVYSTTTPAFTTCCGFTEDDVFAAMDERGLVDREGVKAMYDGYTFGNTRGIYNPWSIVNYLKDPRLIPWWANTSSNILAGKLIREGDADLKQDFMTLLEGGAITTKIDEQIVFDRLTGNPEAVWSLLMVAGYLTPVAQDGQLFELKLTNGEVRQAFEWLVSNWFADTRAYSNFLKALMENDLKYMNRFLNDVAINCFSSFDTGTRPNHTEPERFYHGVVIGMLVDLRDRYILTSNRESGFGRYDVMLEPRDHTKDDAFIFEFKVHDAEDESDLRETVTAALAQIDAKGYAQQLVERGIPAERIRKYGFAFRGKEVLIGQ